jgi:hypothetical protein
MMRIVLVIILMTFFSPVNLKSQTGKKTEQVQQIWTGYFNQTRISKRWGVWLDLHLRTKDRFTDSLSQFLIRPGVTYYIDDKTKLTLGYAFVNHFPADNHSEISQPEHRIWQQIQWHTNYKKLRTMQWVRLEERYRRKIKDSDELADGYNFNFRIRYNFMMQGPITKKLYDKGALNWVFNDELHVNFGKEIVYNYFDQNRLFLGFNYFFTKQNTLQFGYMNLFQQRASGNTYKMIHTARIFFFHNLHL